MVNAHENLKAATAKAHHSIEQVMGPYFNQPTLQSYKEMIQNYAGFYEILENRFRDFSQISEGLQLDQRLQKSAWLKKDLNKLDLKAKDEPKSLDAIPPFTSKAEFLGALYVIEGSTLGGQVLLKRFKETLGVSEEDGGRFFSGYGPDTGPMWRKFLSVLNHEVQTPEDIQSAVRSAQLTFQLMENCMKSLEHVGFSKK